MFMVRKVSLISRCEAADSDEAWLKVEPHSSLTVGKSVCNLVGGDDGAKVTI